MTKTFNSRSRVVVLAYTILSSFDLNAAEMTDGEILAALATAFQARAVEVLAVEDEKRPPRGKPRFNESW